MVRGIALLRAQRGLQAVVARELGLTRAAVTKWQKVPAERLLEVERITGIPREQLRPDLYAGRRCTEAA
jgi:DNA-binding transcriptional regulator YdaS (Cro superfamily)